MTGEEAFNAASALMGEYRPEEENYDLIGFKRSAVQVINVIAAELDGLDCDLKKIDPDSDSHSHAKIGSLSDEIPLHELITDALLPLGMCYMFLSEENPVRADFFLKKYLALLEDLRRRYSRTRRHPIKNVYGAL